MGFKEKWYHLVRRIGSFKKRTDNKYWLKYKEVNEDINVTNTSLLRSTQDSQMNDSSAFNPQSDFVLILYISMTYKALRCLSR